MKKVTLVCVIERISLSDFGVVLTKGEKVVFSEEEIERSPEVRRAIHHGGLVFHSQKNHPRVRDTSRRSVVRKARKVKKPVVTSTLEDRLKGMIADALRNNLGQIMSAIDEAREEQDEPVSEPVPPPAQQNVGVDAETIRAIMNEVISTMPAQHVVVQGSGQSSAHVDDTPMFIPTGIVSDELKADIDTASESSEGSSVDAATEALRQLRKAKKKES